MRREDAAALARQLMDHHGLTEWTFRFDHAKRRAGSCTYATRTITLSGVLTSLYDESAVRAVILHEVAHALAGPTHHHDEVWQAHARRLGAPASTRMPGTLPSPPGTWVGSCPRCGARRELYSAPRRVVACGVCSRTFAVDRILTWTHRGVPADPGGAYAREIRRILRTAA